MKITESSLFTVPEIFKTVGYGGEQEEVVICLRFYFQEGKTGAWFSVAFFSFSCSITF